MIKHTSLIADKVHLTPMDLYQCVHVDLANSKNNTEKVLLVKRIFQGTEKTTKKKEINYTIVGPSSASYKKSNITTDDLKYRKRFKLYSDMYEKIFEERFISKRNTESIWLVRLVTFGTKKSKNPSLKKGFFFTTLFHNLANK